MLACQTPPGAVTDTLAFAGVASGDPYSNVPAAVRDKYSRTAEAAGVSPKGKQYMSSLAAFPGDPEALVDSRGDARRLLEKRGWGATGMVNVKAQESNSPEKPYAPAEDIVEDRAEKMLASDGCDGTCTVKEWDAAKEKATASLTPKKIT